MSSKSGLAKKDPAEQLLDKVSHKGHCKKITYGSDPKSVTLLVVLKTIGKIQNHCRDKNSMDFEERAPPVLFVILKRQTSTIKEKR